jgi:hypothetical protein
MREFALLLFVDLALIVVYATFGIPTTGMMIGRSEPVEVYARVRGRTIPRRLVPRRFAVDRCWCGGGDGITGITPKVGCGKEDLTLNY